MNSDTVLPTLRVRAPVQIATTCEDCDRFLSPLLEATARHTPEAPLVYSLDTEWVNQDTVALVQLALPQCAGGNVVLVRLCVLRDAASITGVPVKFPTSLAAVLSNDALVAVGVGVKNDLKLLREQWPYAHTSTTSIGGNFCLVSTELTSSADQIYKTEAASKILLNGLCGGRCLDLSLLESRQNQGAARPQGKQLGLSALVARLLGHTLIKDTALRCGDWGAENLSISQVEYAALDASAGLSLFHTLAASASGSENASKSAFEGFDATDAFWKSVESVLSRAWLPGDETNPNRRRGRKTGSKDKSISDTSASITSKKSYFVPKTRSHYDGCRLHAPNGTHLANINARRAEWFVPHEKNLLLMLYHLLSDALHRLFFLNIFNTVRIHVYTCAGTSAKVWGSCSVRRLMTTTLAPFSSTSRPKAGPKLKPLATTTMAMTTTMAVTTSTNEHIAPTAVWAVALGASLWQIT